MYIKNTVHFKITNKLEPPGARLDQERSEIHTHT